MLIKLVRIFYFFILTVLNVTIYELPFCDKHFKVKFKLFCIIDNTVILKSDSITFHYFVEMDRLNMNTSRLYMLGYVMQ